MVAFAFAFGDLRSEWQSVGLPQVFMGIRVVLPTLISRSTAAAGEEFLDWAHSHAGYGRCGRADDSAPVGQ